MSEGLYLLPLNFFYSFRLIWVITQTADRRPTRQKYVSGWVLDVAILIRFAHHSPNFYRGGGQKVQNLPSIFDRVAFESLWFRNGATKISKRQNMSGAQMTGLTSQIWCSSVHQLKTTSWDKIPSWKMGLNFPFEGLWYPKGEIYRTPTTNSYDGPNMIQFGPHNITWRTIVVQGAA